MTALAGHAPHSEAADPYCLLPGEAAALLAGHPWQRFAALGDSIAEGVGDRIDGYHPLPFADRLAAELTAARPGLAYLNLGRHGLRARELRPRQLAPALGFAPDLALVVCGANDALRPGYEARADAVDREITETIRALQDAGALVITVSLFVWPDYPGLPAWLNPPPAERMATLARRTAALAVALGTVHVDLAGHPAAADHSTIGGDGLHANARGQAIAAAETIRLLGTALGNAFAAPEAARSREPRARFAGHAGHKAGALHRTATRGEAMNAMNVAVSLRDLLDENVRLDPYPFYASLHEQGRQAVRLGPDERYAAAVFGFQAVDQVLRDPVFRVLESGIADRGGTRWRDHLVLSTLQMSMFNAGGEDLVRLRRLFGQVFSARRVAAMEPAIIRATDRNLDRLAAAGEGGRTVDFMSEFAVPLPADVIGELIGVPQEDRGWFPTRVRTFDAVLELGQRSFRVLEAADGAARELVGYFTDLLAARRAQPHDDLVSALAEAQAENPGQLGEAELLANLVIFFNAGFRTTANLLGSGLTLLLDHPDELGALRDDPALCSAYVEEMLRYEPPVQFVTRYAAEDADIGGVAVAKGQAVIVLIGAANRDPRQFPDPDAFDPTRTDNRQIAFSAGPHYCLGAALGRTEGRLIVPRLLARFPGISLAGEPRGRRQYFMRGYEHLPVEVPVRLTGTASVAA